MNIASLGLRRFPLTQRAYRAGADDPDDPAIIHASEAGSDPIMTDPAWVPGYGAPWRGPSYALN